MNLIKKNNYLLFFIASFLAFFNTKAMAYIDTSTGSYIIQIVLAGLMGIIVTLKIFWKQVKSFFTRGKSGQSQSEDKTD